MSNSMTNYEVENLVDSIASELYNGSFERMRDMSDKERLLLTSLVQAVEEKKDTEYKDAQESNQNVSNDNSDPRVDTRPWEDVSFYDIEKGYLVRSDMRTEFIADHQVNSAWFSEDNKKNVHVNSVGIQVVRYEEKEEKSVYADHDQLKNLMVAFDDSDTTELFVFGMRMNDDEWSVMRVVNGNSENYAINEDSIVQAEDLAGNSIKREDNAKNEDSSDGEDVSDPFDSPANNNDHPFHRPHNRPWQYNNNYVDHQNNDYDDQDDADEDEDSDDGQEQNRFVGLMYCRQNY